MSQPNVKDELSKAEVEPFLPIEGKLVGWSLGIGIALLLVLIAVNHLFPVAI
ncbi:MAG: hypothetical protein ACXWJW_14170 [Xanthobacteraceae bacterium]